MKLKFILIFGIASLLLCSLPASAQKADFNGLWQGEIQTSDNRTLKVALFIDDNNVYPVTKNSDGEMVKDLSKEIIYSKGLGEQLNFMWIDKGGAWTETQFFSLAYIRSGKLSLYFTRHVCNKTSESTGNTDWGYTGKGTLYN